MRQRVHSPTHGTHVHDSSVGRPESRGTCTGTPPPETRWYSYNVKDSTSTKKCRSTHSGQRGRVCPTFVTQTVKPPPTKRSPRSEDRLAIFKTRVVEGRKNWSHNPFGSLWSPTVPRVLPVPQPPRSVLPLSRSGPVGGTSVHSDPTQVVFGSQCPSVPERPPAVVAP